MKAVTIIEIAERAGVSMKTVSRVLNGEPNVRPKTQEKVRKAAKDLNYIPNISARRLASKKSFVIVHLHDNPNSDYLESIYKGVSRTARDAGFFAVMEHLAKPYAQNAEAYLSRFLVDGVILSPPLSDDRDLIENLERLGIPYVRLSPRKDLELSSASYIDDFMAAERMTGLLSELGHKKIAFIAGPAEHGASVLRQGGFKSGIKASGLNVDDCPVLQGDFSVRSGFELCAKLLSSGPAVTAIFAANDDMAIGAVMSAMKAGVDVPSELSIAGFDGSRLGEIIWPQLTTLVQPVEDMAIYVTQQLLTELVQPKGEKNTKLFDVEILVRGTTAPAPKLR